MKIKLFLLTFVFFAFPVFSAPFMQLNEIDELIKETEYDRALEELSVFMKENPEKFDAAQKRVSHILKMRTRYSNLANKLIDVLENDSANDEKILQIISNLEQLEKHPSKTQQKFLSETKFTAQFNVYRKQLYALLKKGLDYAQEGEYVLATQTVKEGYLIYQKDFFETFTDSSITSPVRKTLSEIDELLVLYKTIQERFLKACVSFEASAKSENKNALQNEVESLQKVFSEYAVIRNNVFHRAALLEDVLKVVREKTHDTSDASFLPFAIRFTLGLKSMPYSGIIGTMDLEWDKNLQNLRKNVFSVITKTSADFYSVLQSSLQNLNAISSSSMENYVAFLQVGKSLVALDSLLEEQNKNQVSPTATLDENFLKGMNYALVFSDAIIEQTSSWNELVLIQKNINRDDDEFKNERRNQTYSKSILENLQKLSSVKIFSDDIFSEYKKEAKKIDEEINLKSIYASAFSLYENCTKIKNANAEKLLSMYVDHYVACASFFVEDQTREYGELEKLSKGNVTPVNANAKYPSRVLSLSSSLVKNILSDKEILSASLDNMNKNPSAKKFQSEQNKIISSVSALDDIYEKVLALNAECEKEARLARIAKNEADLRYEQARNSLFAGDYETARNKIQESRTKYNESLSHEEDENLRKSSDEKLLALGREITVKQNELIVQEIRKQKNEARSEYYNGNFEKAEIILTQAKNTWALTNVDEDEELATLYALVNSALLMKTGRVISSTSPLYKEMSQVMSIAQQYFKAGLELLNQKKVEEGKVMMLNASEKLKELMIVYPLNKEANLLTLRIQQHLNPEGFAKLFEERVALAKDTYTVKGKQEQAYSDLQDLYEINPNYPGLKKLINDVEIELGLRQKPIDRVALNKSSALTKEARAIFERSPRDEVRLQSALSNLNEALVLNPANEEAMILKDRINIAIGGRASIVLSSEDEAKYQAAVSEMQKNNLVTANALLEQLLQKSENRKSAKILDLQKRIKALL